MTENEIATKAIGCAIEVHKKFGAGLMERAYHTALHYRLTKCGLFVESEKAMPLNFEEVKLDCGYRIDLLVENKLVIEVKAVESFAPIHMAQIMTYLKLGDYRLGLLMNFNVTRMMNGIKRVANGLEE